MKGRKHQPPLGGYESPRESSPPPGMLAPTEKTERRRASGPPVEDLERSSPSQPAFFHSSTLDRIIISTAQNGTRGRKVGVRDRIKCYQWTWFTMTMATGGVANVLSSVPFKAEWVTVIGTMFFFINLILFIMNIIFITLRFRWCPGSFIASFTDQFESLFIPSSVVSVGIVFITVCEYGVPQVGPWLLKTMEVAFWIYIAVSTLTSAGMYLVLWSTQIFPIHTMTPIWVFPAYPLLLTAPFGSILISVAVNSQQPDQVNRVAVAVASVTTQGAAFLISYMVMAAFLYRLMTQKLPRDTQRPGIFVSIGPAAFTVAGIVGLGNQTKDIVPKSMAGADHAVIVFQLLSWMLGLWLWGLSMWFFLVSVGSLLKYIRPENRAKMPFQMTWFSFVFPNTALVTATEQLARAFGSRPLEILACVLAGCLILVWLVVFLAMLKSLWRKQILWPKDAE
ncbi:hypothetical protein GQ53DRAFT_318787 [Thozetella sp. PMI_491]|nr:hypothetical protein GQ53DRAFT_318787 [Thozetella sp. PMI_491]